MEVKPLYDINKIYISKQHFFDTLNNLYKTPSISSPACDLDYLIKLENSDYNIYRFERPVDELPSYKLKTCKYTIEELHQMVTDLLIEKELPPLGFTLGKFANKSFYLSLLEREKTDQINPYTRLDTVENVILKRKLNPQIQKISQELKQTGNYRGKGIYKSNQNEREDIKKKKAEIKLQKILKLQEKREKEKQFLQLKQQEIQEKINDIQTQNQQQQQQQSQRQQNNQLNQQSLSQLVQQKQEQLLLQFQKSEVLIKAQQIIEQQNNQGRVTPLLLQNLMELASQSANMMNEEYE